MGRRRAYASLAVLLTRKEAVQFATTIVLLGEKLDPPGWGGSPMCWLRVNGNAVPMAAGAV